MENLQEKLALRDEIIYRFAGDFIYIFCVNLLEDSFEIIQKSEDGTGLVQSHVEEDFFSTILETVPKYFSNEDWKFFEQKFSLNVIDAELNLLDCYNFTLPMTLHNSPQFVQFRFQKAKSVDMKDCLLVGIYDVDKDVRNEMYKMEQVRRTEQKVMYLEEKTGPVNMDAHMDALTGLNNRQSYEQDIKSEILLDTDFIYMSIVVDGLMDVNKGLGHEAGDELIRGAAFCMNTCLAPYGEIYRIAGDEFVAIIYADQSQLAEILNEFDQTMAEWKGKILPSLSMSYGCVFRADYPKLSVKEIAKLANERMTDTKADAFVREGVDIRGQKEAFDTVCKLYTKIIRVNLSTEHYSIIQADDTELGEHMGYHESSISQWLDGFVKAGGVHVEDVENFCEKVSMDYMRKYFEEGHAVLSVFYRRKEGDKYIQSMMEVVPYEKNSVGELIAYLYVKKLEM